jgi:hypothetical protein
VALTLVTLRCPYAGKSFVHAATASLLLGCNVESNDLRRSHDCERVLGEAKGVSRDVLR